MAITRADSALGRRAFLSTSSRLALGASLAVLGRAPAEGQDRIPSERAWQALAGLLSGPVLRPWSPGYLAVARPNNLRYARVLPAGIARCQSSQDVARSILWSREHRVPLITRSGGHSYAGFSSAPGLMIDVSPIHSASFNTFTGVATIGGGTRNGAVTALLTPHEVAITHGRCPGVGAAAFLLGGGIGFNMRQHGVGCDQVVAAELVAADGQILALSATQNPELFWACRGGGGGNFGINTSFSVQTFHVEPLTVFRIGWGTRPEEVLPVLMSALDAAPRKLGCRISVAAVSPRQQEPVYGQGPGISLLGQYQGPADGVLDILAPAYRVAAPGSESLFEMSYWDAQNYLSEPGPSAFYQVRSAFLTEPTLGPRALDVAFHRLRRWPGVGAGGDLRFFQTGGRVNDVPPDATAFVHRESRWLLEVGRNWTASDSPETVARTQDWQDDFYEAIRPFTDGRAYQNFPDPSLTDWRTAYYGENLARLSCAKGQVDPHRVFRFPQAIPPARCG
jgi:FAD/FMN-containing dehydrogenase